MQIKAGVMFRISLIFHHKSSSVCS